MSEFKIGQYVQKKETGSFRKILDIHGRIYFLSVSWSGNPEYTSAAGLKREQELQSLHTDDEMKAYYESVSDEEATGKKSRWIPAKGESYYYPNLLEGGARAHRFYGDEIDRMIVEKVPVFRTREEAEAYELKARSAIKSALEKLDV